MPRANLSISQELYDQIEKAAKKENVTVNYYICEMLEEKFSKKTVYGYALAIANMIDEAKKMDKEFTLADLPTFASVGEVVKEYKIAESPAQVRARLGKMFNEAVRKGTAKGIERAVVKKNGKEEFKFLSRAAVYVNSSKTKKK
ncbi:hypothetical protein [Butyrivibrio sp. VCB2006]|uniref:hypothetical protein n=1 Tax=Butyrivibrio sp. VCB2006 TaxID=1280679 RepID=UPI0004078DB6|nr:hypothetical protein [Butyrivibrio sp. VCB2006]